MSEPIPYWVGAYVGLPFKERGRTLKGCDCWGLMRIILETEFGLTYPSMCDGYVSTKDRGDIAKLYIEERATDDWVRINIGKERLGDVLVFKIGDVPCHVGMVITRGKMLHIEKGTNSTFVPYNTIRWKDRIDAVYRPRGLQLHAQQ